MGKLFEFDEHIGDWRVLVQSRDIQNGAIQSRHIASGAVTGDKIDNNAIQSRHIAPGAVTGDKIDDNAIQSRHIAPGAVTPDKIAPGAIDDIRILFQDLVDNYKPIVINGDVTNAPDEEDITSVDGLLKLKNRSAALSTMGYKILRRGTPLSEQMNLINTIYDIRYDFDLDGETVNMPENCVLKFEGGSLSNGNVVGQDTGIIADIVGVFGSDISLSGRWKVDVYYPEWFGAVTDDENIDSTNAIQKAVDVAGNSYGGTIQFSQGIYYIGTINLSYKTSLKGKGIGVTILKQINGSDGPGIYAASRYSIFMLKDFTLRHDELKDENSAYIDPVSNGIVIDTEETGEEHREIAWNEINDSDYSAPYKRILVDNVMCSGFHDGILLRSKGFCTFITNCYFSENYRYGMNIQTTDSTINNCYVNNNRTCGIIVSGSNNKIENIKCIFSGEINPADGAAVAVLGCRNSFVNIETQDNFSKAFLIGSNAVDNQFVNCFSNSDGYVMNDPKGYRPGNNLYGFQIENVDNSFMNCGVTQYSYDKYGSLLDAPVKMRTDKTAGKEVDIKVTLIHKKGLFRNPTYYLDTSSPTHNLAEYLVDPKNPVKSLEGINYINLGNNAFANVCSDSKDCISMFASFSFNEEVVGGERIMNFPTESLFRLMDADTLVFAIRGVDNMDNTYSIRGRIGNYDFGERIDGAWSYAASTFNKSDYGAAPKMLVVCLTYKNNSLTLRGYISKVPPVREGITEESNAREYTAFYYRMDASGQDPFRNINRLAVSRNCLINKVIVTRESIDDSDLVPGAEMSKYRAAADVYISAENLMWPLNDRGYTERRPSVEPDTSDPDDPVKLMRNDGFCYYDTDLKKPVYMADDLGYVKIGDNDPKRETRWYDTEGAIAGTPRMGSSAQLHTIRGIDVYRCRSFCFLEIDQADGVRPLWAVTSRSGEGTEQDPYVFVVDWCEYDGIKSDVRRSGSKEQRPSGDTIYVGFQYMQVDAVNGTFPIWASAITRTGEGTEQDPYVYEASWVKADGTDPDRV